MTHLKVTRCGPKRGTPKTGKNYEERNYFPEIVVPSFPYSANSNHVNTDTKGADKGEGYYRIVFMNSSFVTSRNLHSQENS